MTSLPLACAVHERLSTNAVVDFRLQMSSRIPPSGRVERVGRLCGLDAGNDRRRRGMQAAARSDRPGASWRCGGGAEGVRHAATFIDLRWWRRDTGTVRPGSQAGEGAAWTPAAKRHHGRLSGRQSAPAFGPWLDVLPAAEPSGRLRTGSARLRHTTRCRTQRLEGASQLRSTKAAAGASDRVALRTASAGGHAASHGARGAWA